MMRMRKTRVEMDMDTRELSCESCRGRMIGRVLHAKLLCHHAYVTHWARIRGP